MVGFALPTPLRGMIANCHDWPDDPKPFRPVLILEVFTDEDDKLSVFAVYGTSKTPGVHPSKVLVAKKDEERSMKLERDTSFTFTLTGVIPLIWSAEHFGKDETGTEAIRGMASESFVEAAVPYLDKWRKESASELRAIRAVQDAQKKAQQKARIKAGMARELQEQKEKAENRQQSDIGGES